MFTICVDNSGSTNYHINYWNTVAEIAKRKPDAKFLLWDTSAKSISYNDMLKYAETKKGCGGTDPTCFVSYLKENTDVIIVTDGQIDSSSVEKCDKLLNEKPFNSVEMHFINTGGRMDMSVSAPFVRKTNYKLFKDGVMFSEGSSKLEFDLKEYFNNPEKFIEDNEKLLNQITITTMGRPNIQLRNKVIDLKENLLKTVTLRQSANSTESFAKLRGLLSTSYSESLEFMKNFVNGLTTDETAKTIDHMAQVMIDRCANSKNFDFSLLQPSRLMRAAVVEDIGEELPEIEQYDGGFVCPISFDNDMPCCLIAEGEPVLQGLENSYLNSLMVNPLLLLNNRLLVNKLKARLDHILGLEAINALVKQGNFASPMTRKPIVSILSFGTDKTHMKATKFTLANLFFGNKLSGLHELWLSTIYFVMSEIEYLNSNTDFMNEFKSYLVGRFSKNNTNMTLSGLPIEPLIKAPMDISVWYCVVSPFIKNPNSFENRLRNLCASGQYLLKLLDMFGFPYDREYTEKRLKLYNVFNWMMNSEKVNDCKWQNQVKSCYQNSMVLSDGTIIMLDGPSTKNYLPSICDGLSIKEVYGLSLLVDRSKKNDVVNIPSNFDKDVPYYETNYRYKQTDYLRPILICAKTMRPYVNDRTTHQHWTDSAVEVYGNLDEILSCKNYYIKFVMDYVRYPSKEELIKYISEKQMNREFNPKATLPSCMSQFADETIDEYGKVIVGVNAHDFIRITKVSRNRDVRLTMES